MVRKRDADVIESIVLEIMKMENREADVFGIEVDEFFLE